MEFLTVLKSIFTMMSFMAMGYILVKTGKANPSHGKSFSTFLIYCGTPGMFIASFQEMTFSRESGKSLLLFFLVSMLMQVLMYLIMLLFLRKKLEEGKYRILSIASFMGNVGFFGQPLIQALFPDHPIASCYSMMIALSMNMLIFTLGEYMISRDRKYITLKRVFINPTVLAAIVAIPMYILNIKLPTPVYNISYILRSMNGPVCMIILGLRLATMNMKEIFSDPFNYVVSFCKLLLFPLLCLAALQFIPSIDRVFKVALIISAGTPCASVILALAEVHSCEEKRAACIVLMSSIFCIITLPLLTLLVR
ncbi:MAG: AEC family transporter [Sphaerochaetaceae bacterium]|nr:AEC family transporter [Sphaerochaetaceae bacterium]